MRFQFNHQICCMDDPSKKKCCMNESNLGSQISKTTIIEFFN